MRERALAALTRREFSRSELRRKLLAHAQNEPDALDVLLDELQAQGWLSDHRFVAMVARRSEAGQGSLKIQQTLRAHELEPELVNQAMQDVRLQDEAGARALWMRRFGSAPHDMRERNRQLRFLMTRGYPGHIVSKLVPAVVGGRLSGAHEAADDGCDEGYAGDDPQFDE